MSSINQELLPLYRIQSFRKICRYAPFFDKGLHLSINLADYTYRSIWRIILIDQSGAIRCIRCCTIFQEFLQKSSKNLWRIFQESFFFFFLFSFFFLRLNFSIFFWVLKLKVFKLIWILRKVYALFLRNINIVLSSDLNALKIVNYSGD